MTSTPAINNNKNNSNNSDNQLTVTTSLMTSIALKCKLQVFIQKEDIYFRLKYLNFQRMTGQAAHKLFLLNQYYEANTFKVIS